MCYKTGGLIFIIEIKEFSASIGLKGGKICSKVMFWLVFKHIIVMIVLLWVNSTIFKNFNQFNRSSGNGVIPGSFWDGPNFFAEIFPKLSGTFKHFWKVSKFSDWITL